METIKLGLFGAGGISSRVVKGIVQSENCKLTLICSRDINKARQLAEQFDVANYSDDYNDLFKDDIDGIYIVTINKLHYQHIKLCLENKKHVICEKPMLFNEKEIDELYDLADKNNVLLLEAMKCRYLPTVSKIKQLLNDYPYPRNVTATFCRDEPFSKDYNHSYYDSEYGGAMKTIGCYVYSWIFELFPEKVIESDLQLNIHNGVENEAWLYLKNEKEMFMQLGCSVNYNTDNLAVISGDNYQIKIRDFWKDFDIEVWQKDKIISSYKEDIGSEFAYQVDFFGETIKKADWLKVNQLEREFLKRVVSYYPTSR